MSQSVPAVVRTLLIEDQGSEASFARRMLVRPLHQDFTVEHVPTLAEGIQQLSVNDFDVCILNLGLPDGSGMDSLHQIRSVDGRIPVVVLTGSDDEQLGLVAIETGTRDFLAKDAITGQLLSRSLRFASLFAKTEVDQATAIVEDLLSQDESTKFKAQPELKVAASVGVSQVATSETPEDRIRLTAIALSAAKQTGRKRICAAQE